VSTVVNDYAETTMKYYGEKKRDALFPYERFLSVGEFNEQALTADVLLAIERRPPTSESESAPYDYSEEAIPERDPAYRLPVGADSEEATVEVVSAEVRLELARRLHELGMSRARATIVASL
jgi:hypothetical protein